MFFRGIGVLKLSPWDIKDSSVSALINDKGKFFSKVSFFFFNLWHQCGSLEERSQARGRQLTVGSMNSFVTASGFSEVGRILSDDWL